MFLDNRTLLFSLVLISGLMALSLAIVSRGEKGDGLRIWAGAMGLGSLAWMLIAIRGSVPNGLSIIVPNLFLVAAQAMKLAAVYKFRELPWPRWRCLLPIGLMFILLIGLDYGDFRHRLMFSSLIYGAQMLLMLEILRTDTESKKGRAWWLLFGSTVAIIPIFALRALAAFIGSDSFATMEGNTTPNTIQMLMFVCVIALDILGSLGFILMDKERVSLELRDLAMTDFLTKVLNRRAFMMRAEQEIAAAQRSGSPLALLMIDIDHFKRINDEYGHAVGDRVLEDVARVISFCVRKQDTVGRYGGEEFGVLLPATNQNGALVLAEKLRNAVERKQYQVGQKSISVTISAGITVCQAICPTCQTDINRLIDDADKALYEAKNGGRNRTAVTQVGCAVS